MFLLIVIDGINILLSLFVQTQIRIFKKDLFPKIFNLLKMTRSKNQKCVPFHPDFRADINGDYKLIFFFYLDWYPLIRPSLHYSIRISCHYLIINLCFLNFNSTFVNWILDFMNSHLLSYRATLLFRIWRSPYCPY